MKTYLDCIPCFFKQALFAARTAVDDERKIKAVLDQVGRLVSDIPLHDSPPETGREVYRIVREVTGVDDPFEGIKRKNTKHALALYPQLKKMVETAEDPLETAVRLAIAGNVIDFGANPDFKWEGDLRKIVKTRPVLNHYESFRQALPRAETVLYLADNAGETVFDRILIEILAKPVVYAVRDRPVINDATVEDAVESGIDEVATIVSSGWDGPGVPLNKCSASFRDRFVRADLVVSKGQGNYETLSREKKPIFFFLTAKCSVVARDLGIKQDDGVIKYADSGKTLSPPGA